MSRSLKASSILAVLLLAVAAPHAAPPAGNGPVFLRIGERSYGADALRAWVRQAEPLADVDALPEATRKHWIETFQARKLLALKAREMGLLADPEIQARVDWLVDSLLAQALQERMAASIRLTEEEIERAYREDANLYRSPARARVVHLVLPDAQGADAARLRLEEAATLEDLREEFPGLVLSERSWLGEDQLPRPVADAVFGLVEGGISPVVVTPYGHHVARLERLEPARLAPLSSVREQVASRLRQQRAAQAIETLLEEIRRRPDVEAPRVSSLP